MCCLCCKSDPIKATITIHRQGHVPGEAVLFDAEINNESKRDLKSSRIRFMMVRIRQNYNFYVVSRWSIYYLH